MKPSLRARVTFGFAALTLLLALVSGVSLYAVTRLGGAVDTILRENYRSVIACEDMKEALERQDSALQFVLHGHADIGRPMLAAHRAAFARAYAVEASNLTLPEEGARVRDIDRQYRAYLAMVDETLDGRGGDEVYFARLLPAFETLKDHIQAVLRLNQATMLAADGRARATARTSVAVTLLVGFVAVVLALVFAWRLPRSIVGPVASLAEAATAIGRGELQVVVGEAEVTELVPLVEAFRKMIERLRAYRESSLGELLAAKDLANATVRCLVDAVMVLGADGAVLLTNEVATETFGVEAGSADELRDRPLPEAFVSAREAVLATGEPVSAGNLAEAMRWRNKRGERFFLVRAAPLLSEGDEGARVLVLAQDVTRLRRIDALKSDMVATVSHEFKTPLTSLRMGTHLLLEPTTGALTEGQREIVTMARDDTERLRALVDELLDLVRIETEAGALRRSVVDPARLLAGAAEAHQGVAREKGVRVVVEAVEAGLRVACDAEKMAIVLANLVSNAVRHTEAGGTVVLGARAEDGRLRMTVRDSGEGAPVEALAEVLARSARGVRTGAPHAGRHGLGLTIAQEIVLQHGGELTVASAVGEGSEFAVVLPVG